MQLDSQSYGVFPEVTPVQMLALEELKLCSPLEMLLLQVDWDFIVPGQFELPEPLQEDLRHD